MAQFTNNPLTITANADTEVRAVFIAAPLPPPPQESIQGFYNVVVSTDTPNYGSVALTGLSGSPTRTNSSISGRVELGNNFTIAANSLSGYRFSYWNFYVQRANGEGSFTSRFTDANPFEFSTLDEGATLTFVAVFEPVLLPQPSVAVQQYLVQLLPQPSSRGSVFTEGGTLSGLTVFKQVPADNTISIQATPAQGSRFKHWYNPTTGNVVSTSSTSTIRVTADITLWAVFEEIPPQPSPSPSAQITIQWRSCIDGILRDGTAPFGYREVEYTGAGGGMCWEPITDVTFQPNLATALLFKYQRGSSEYPQPVTVTATNPAYGTSYKVTLKTNPDVIITPSAFTLDPRGSKQFVVNVTPQLLEKLGDGESTLRLDVEVSQV